MTGPQALSAAYFNNEGLVWGLSLWLCVVAALIASLYGKSFRKRVLFGILTGSVLYIGLSVYTGELDTFFSSASMLGIPMLLVAGVSALGGKLREHLSGMIPTGIVLAALVLGMGAGSRLLTALATQAKLDAALDASLGSKKQQVNTEGP